MVFLSHKLVNNHYASMKIYYDIFSKYILSVWPGKLKEPLFTQLTIDITISFDVVYKLPINITIEY